MFDAKEAFEKRLVNRVVDDAAVLEQGYATARRIANGAPLVARWHKKFVRRLAQPAPLSAEESCQLVQARWEEAMVALYGVADPDSDTLEAAEEEQEAEERRREEARYDAAAEAGWFSDGDDAFDLLD